MKNLRAYENLHIVLWLLKDTCWVLTWRVPGLIMIVPTLFVALHITWRSRKTIADFFHNLAVSLWICANASWMIGEFYYDDGTRPIAIVFFVAGISVVAFYYIFLNNRKNREAIKNK